MVNKVVKNHINEEDSKVSKSIEQLEKEQLKYMKAIAKSNRFDQVILRGCLIGIFSALGTTVGFAVVLFFIANLLSGIRDVPFVDNLIADTKLDLLIESQIASLSGGTKTVEETEGEAEQTDPNAPLVYSDTNIGFEISYPNFLDYNVTNKSGEVDTNYIFTAEGSGVINSIELYVNQDPNIYDLTFTSKVYEVEINQDLSQFTEYPDGVNIDGVNYERAIFVYSTNVDGEKIDIVAIADEDTPRIAREIFREVVESFTRI